MNKYIIVNKIQQFCQCTCWCRQTSVFTDQMLTILCTRHVYPTEMTNISKYSKVCTDIEKKYKLNHDALALIINLLIHIIELNVMVLDYTSIK